jgi:hypothetical protein
MDMCRAQVTHLDEMNNDVDCMSIEMCAMMNTNGMLAVDMTTMPNDVAVEIASDHSMDMESILLDLD